MKIEILGKKEDQMSMQNTAKLFQRISSMLGIRAEITLTHNFKGFMGTSFDASKTPIVFINGKVEFAGNVPNQKILQLKLTQLRNQGGDLF